MTEVGKYVVIHEAQADGSTKIVLDIFNLDGTSSSLSTTAPPPLAVGRSSP